jgi:hypothetical protein
MVCEAIRMESEHLNKVVAANVAAAIRRSGRSEASIARDTGIALTSLRRNLAGLNGASFKVADLALIGALLNEDPADFFTEQVAA